MDAFVTFLLAAFGCMVVISLNWWPHPIRWFSSLARTDKFTFVVANFTAVLALATCVQVWAFMESERAELVIDDTGFARGEPSPEANGLDVIVAVRNFGKHVATIEVFNVSPAIFIRNKKLPDIPEYRGGSITPVVPPIAPGKQIMVYGQEDPQNFGMPIGDVINGILDGSITMRIYGFVRYYTGYSVFGPSEVGYCFAYLPERRRHTSRFEVCDNPNYTYTRR